MRIAHRAGRLMAMVVTVGVFCACSASGPTGPTADLAASLEQQVLPIDTISPSLHGFADLQPLREDIGDARIVLLGEPSHGDGAAFLAKCRLIRFLHEEMDFDVLAFESGLYDCRKAWDLIQEGEEALNAARRGVFSIWTRSRQVVPVLDYLGAQAQGGHPLELAGVDCQFTGSASRDYFLSDLVDHLSDGGSEIADAAWWPGFADILTRLVEHAYQDEPPSASEQSAFADGYGPLQEELDRLEVDLADTEGSFWSQMGRSLAAQARTDGLLAGRGTDPDLSWIRDDQMGKNLIWLATEAYRDRKIIVWAATFHIATQITGIDRLDGPDYSFGATMGQVARQTLGGEMYTVGFTASRGRFGTWWAEPRELEPPLTGSLEDAFLLLDMPYGWLDLRDPDLTHSRLRDRIVSRPLGYAAMRADWGTVVDAMVFIRDMTPSTWSYR